MSSSSRRHAARRVVASFSPDASEKLVMMSSTASYNYRQSHSHNRSRSHHRDNRQQQQQRRAAASRAAVAGCYRVASGRGPAPPPPPVRCFRSLRSGVARVLRFLFGRRSGGGKRGRTSCASSVSSFSSTSSSSLSSSSSSRARVFSSASVHTAPRTTTNRPPPSPYCGYVLDDTYRHQSQDIQDCIDFIKFSSSYTSNTAAGN